jgi:trehalose/maltose hydrolase-like predicted phosphorylase
MSVTVAQEDFSRRRYEALMFDWDGTAVPDRGADAGAVRAAVEAACALGLDVAVVSGTHLQNIDGQLAARPNGPGELHLLLNRGSEVFRAGADGPRLLERRVASPAEDRALDRAAALTVKRLGERGLEARIVSQRLNRRKIDLIPQPEWADPPKARIGELLDAVQARLRGHAIDGLRAAVSLGETAALDAGLQGACVTSDAKHVEIGLTDKADSARWYFAHLWRRGVWAEQTMLLGDELGPLGGLPGSDSRLMIERAAGATVVSVGAEPAGVPEGVIAAGGGPARFLLILQAQIDLRRDRALPIVPSGGGWTLRVGESDHERERVHESLLTLADGRLGTRGSLLAPSEASLPGVVMAGVYRGHGERSELQPAPLWNRLEPVAPGGPAAETVRTLDLHAGLLAHRGADGLSALQFSSLAEPGVAAMCALGPQGRFERSPPLLAPPGVHPKSEEDDESGGVSMRIEVADGTLEAAGAQSIEPGRSQARDAPSVLDRVVAYAATGEGDTSRPALQRLRRARAAGRERLLIDHRRAWAKRWEHADVRIEGDPDLQLATRLALYHLMGSVGDEREAAVGARGLSGSGYRGHVFWDSDVFVLPFLAATHPASARSLLEYRVRRLSAAQAAARAEGRRGARFAWESAATGADVTPRAVRNRAGREVAIHTGEREEHIVADVAWATACYLDWTGDETFRAGAGRRLLIETARYWASRIERDPSADGERERRPGQTPDGPSAGLDGRDGSTGRAHIRGVIGPDEYHELVDDNAYTNVMARWNLRRAYAESTDGDVEDGERGAWLALADALVDGYEPASGRYEQFAGFFELEPLVIAQLAPRRPIAADLLLGGERVAQAQVVKQADVLMLHQLVPDELAPGSLEPNLDFYEPRTAHGSSLSPGIHAGLLARAGRLSEALAALRLTARIDLDDISASTAAGVHLAAMGSVWQALAYGFAGVRPRGETLSLDPRLPGEWRALELRLRFRDAKLHLRIGHAQIEIEADLPVRVSVGGGPVVTVGPGGYRGEGAGEPTAR